MQRMVHGLHVPEVYRGPSWERLLAFPTFDLRLVSTPGEKGPGRIRLFLLAKVFVPVEGADIAAAARAGLRAGRRRLPLVPRRRPARPAPQAAQLGRRWLARPRLPARARGRRGP